jgi:hypothetical protein
MRARRCWTTSVSPFGFDVSQVDLTAGPRQEFLALRCRTLGERGKAAVGLGAHLVRVHGL